MRKSFITSCFLALAFLISNSVQAQKFKDLDKSPMDVAAYPSSYKESNKLVKVTYSRPQLKGRSVDKLASKGKVWRTGANEATEITFYQDVIFGGKEVEAGTYTLFTIPGDEEWIIILSSAENVWGSYYYKEEEDVARATGKVSKSEKSIEAFSICFEGEGDNITMYLGWGETLVSLSIIV